METGDYETNALLINNIASIAFRIFEPTKEQSQNFHTAALQVESALREQGHIVFYDASRRGIWLFEVISKDAPGEAVISQLPETKLETCGHSLVVQEEGTLDPASLHKIRTATSGPGQYPAMSTSAANAALDPSQRSHSLALTTSEADLGLVPSSSAETQTVDQKAIYEHFMAAVISKVSSAFCGRMVAMPLNYRTVLIPSSLRGQDSLDSSITTEDPLIGTFRPYLTTSGSLVISLYFTVCKSLASLDNAVSANLMPLNRPIVAAPFGVLATRQGSSNGDSSVPDTALGQTPNTQALSFWGLSDAQESAWKHTCLKALGFRGLESSTFKTCSWIKLLVSRRFLQDGDGDGKRSQATVFWPGPLCFRKKPIEVSATSRLGDTLLSGHDECHDPLATARGWFMSTGERDERVAKRKSERTAAVARDSIGNELAAQRPSANSPMALRRPSAAAVGVMYPTPPDAPQQSLGVAQSLDGTTSSPANQPPTATLADTDTTMSNTNHLGDAYPDTWEGTNELPRQARSDPPMLDNTENMFGDIGADMFGDNDITEDDFNFFDEDPGGDGLDVEMEDLNDTHIPPPPPQPPPIPEVVHPPQQEVPELPMSKPKPSSDDTVFAKPELKHARSSLNDVSNGRNKMERLGSIKRESSPFNPDTVFKRVRATLTLASNESNKSLQRPRRNSIFDKVDFDPHLPMINKKYQQGGAFDYSADQRAKKYKPVPEALPKTAFFKRQGTQKKLKPLPLLYGFAKPFSGIEGPTSHPSPTKPDGGFLSDLDDSDIESDQDNSSSTSEPPPISPLKSSLKRVNLEDDVVSQATSVKDMDILDEPDEQLTLELPTLRKLDPPEMSLYKFFSDPEPLSLDLGLSDVDLIQIAQLVTEQAATGFLQIGACPRSIDTTSLTSTKGQVMAIARSSLQVLQSIICASFGGATPTQFKGFLEVQDAPLAGQPNRPQQPRPVPGREQNPEQFRPNSLYQIPSPHLEVRRSETKLSVLPSAVTFWESLGLAPSPGIKDIHGLCVFPGWKGMADSAGTFLSRMKSVYESLKLGTFSNMPLAGDMEDGILPFEVDRISTSPDATVTGHGSALIESLETLRTSLTDWDATKKNLVLFFVYSSDNPGSIVEACSSFRRCFDMYKRILAGRREQPQNEVVMQLVSIDFISSPAGLVIPPPSEFMRLCMETYDRCTLFPGPGCGSPTAAPAVMLEQPLPRVIGFELTMQPSASLLHENSCIHVAYAQSIDDRWITAAWTDNRGYQQASASYCLGRRGKPLASSMSDIAAEIWLSTLELISIWNVHWRLIVTKCGPMDQQEMNYWIDLARTESKASVTLTLITVDTNPSLQLIPPAMKVPLTATSTFYSTPVSTPQANILSPEQINTPMTPMRDANAAAGTPGADSAADTDTDAFLVDITDQTWGAVAGHRLSNSTSPLEVRPALVSGYLIKRAGNRAEDPPILMEVNLVHIEAQPRAYEPLFREMLSHFRGLGTLARARGVVDREADVRPWHVAVAEKGVRALYLLL